MKKKRDKIFVYPTWIAKLVAGEEQCEWKYWLKAHYLLDKKPSDFNLAKWIVEHNQLLKQRRDDLEKDGYVVFIEDQNAFKLDIQLQTKEGRVNPQDPCIIIISGKADIIAIKENIYLVEDCKTGNPKTSDHIQVIEYMLFLPKAVEKYKDVRFNGCIVYKLGIPNMDIPSYVAYDDPTIKKIIWDTIKQITGEEVNCRKVPSVNECNKCDVCKEDCLERIEK